MNMDGKINKKKQMKSKIENKIFDILTDLLRDDIDKQEAIDKILNVTKINSDVI